VAERATSGAGEDAGAAVDAAGDVAGAADATDEFARAATAGCFFLRCFFPAPAGAARNSTKTVRRWLAGPLRYLSACIATGKALEYRLFLLRKTGLDKYVDINIFAA